MAYNTAGNYVDSRCQMIHRLEENEIKKEELVRAFSQSLVDGNGAIFAGAGLSSISGVPIWVDLLKPIAKTALDLDLSSADPLPEIAQYIVNHYIGNRGPLIDHVRQMIRDHNQPNEYHHTLAKTNVGIIWTTNYDDLIEKAVSAYVPTDVKTDEASVTRIPLPQAIEIIKMHGCIYNSGHSDIVVTLRDYEDYSVRRPAMVQRLQRDLLSHSFLFLGYSYGDPNIRTIVVEAARLAQSATRRHFMVVRKPEGVTDDEWTKTLLWLEDLRRVGIESVLVGAYSEVQEILSAIALKSRGPGVYVTGSHSDADSPFARDLGRMLAEATAAILLDGQSMGISRVAASAFAEACIGSKYDIHGRLKIFPNPYAANPDLANRVDLIPVLKQWRAKLLRSAQVVVAFPGGMGTEAEIEAAVALDCIVLPVPIHAGDSSHRLVSSGGPNLAALSQLDPEYLNLAKQCMLTPARVIECVSRILAQ